MSCVSFCFFFIFTVHETGKGTDWSGSGILHEITEKGQHFLRDWRGCAGFRDSALLRSFWMRAGLEMNGLQFFPQDSSECFFQHSILLHS